MDIDARESMSETMPAQETLGQDVVNQARAVVAGKIGENIWFDRNRLDQAIGEFVHHWQSADEARHYLAKLQANPNYHLLVHHFPILEEVRRRSDIDEFFRVKISKAYSQWFFPTNAFKADMLHQIGYNYLKQKAELPALAAEATEPTEELQRLAWDIEQQRLANLRQVLGDARVADLDRFERFFTYLLSGGSLGAEVNLDDLPRFAQTEDRLNLRRAAVHHEATSPRTLDDLPPFTETDFEQIIPAILENLARAKDDQPKRD